MATLGWKYKKFPYKCRVCGESFSSKKYLKEHQEYGAYRNQLFGEMELNRKRRLRKVG
jgi:predicted nucleic acid binding AN1-type Zn finger protein